MSILLMPLYLAAGIASGTVYFRFLWWDVRRLVAAGSPAITILSMLGRIALLGGVLALASKQGALPLLLVALGVFIARFVITLGVRAPAP